MVFCSAVHTALHVTTDSGTALLHIIIYLYRNHGDCHTTTTATATAPYMPLPSGIVFMFVLHVLPYTLATPCLAHRLTCYTPTTALPSSRLTQSMVSGLGAPGPEGPFRAACEAALGALRSRREPLVALLDAVLGDPLVEWAAERGDAAARQDLELAVSLNLFVSRCGSG